MSTKFTPKNEGWMSLEQVFDVLRRNPNMTATELVELFGDMTMDTENQQLRVRALELARSLPDTSAADTVARAEKYLQFLTSGSVGAARSRSPAKSRRSRSKAANSGARKSR